MILICCYIAFIIFLLFFVNSSFGFNIYAVSSPSKDDLINLKKELQTISNTNNNDNIINLSSITEKPISIQGTVNSFLSISQSNFWIATGNWTINFKDNIPTFELDMTWHNNKDSTPRTYNISNFKPTDTKTEIQDNILITKGTVNISINNQTESKIPITIQIQKNKIMTIYFNDTIFNRHFNKQPVYGIVTSFETNNTTNTNENTISPSITTFQKPINSQIQNPVLNKNIISDNANNTIDHEDTNNNENNLTSRDNTNYVVIPENAGLLGNPSYSPSTITINKGDKLMVINNDKTYHTVTSINEGNTNNSQLGKFFDTSTIEPLKSTIIDTLKLEPGIYQYECSIHPFMKGNLIIK